MIPLSLPVIGKEELQAVKEVLRSGWLTHGKKNEEFERLVADYVGVKRALAVNSCASALHVSLLAAGIRGEVLVPSFTFVASVNAIVTCGATPVFVDVEEETCNMNANLLEQHITPRTEAIMPVHYAGLPCDMPAIMKVADKRKLFVLEDAAECLGGECAGRKAGSFGVGCFSFFPTKNITTGEGGMITTNDESLAAKIKALAGHGISTTTHERQALSQKPRWHREAVVAGYNFRMSQIHAAIGVEQMKKIKSLNEKRRTLASLYRQKLKRNSNVVLQAEKNGYTHVYQMVVARVPEAKRNELVSSLNAQGIGASVHFDPPAHLQEAHKQYRHHELPVTEKLCKEVLTLPMYPMLKKRDVRTVCAALLKCLNA